MKLTEDTVRKIALQLIEECSPWEVDAGDDITYVKMAMYTEGVLEMSKAVIKAIGELKTC